MIRLPELLFVYYYTTTSPSLSWLFTKFTSPSWFRGVWSWSFGFVVDIFWSTCCRWVCLCSYFMDRLQVIRWLWTKVIPDQQLYFDDYSEQWWHSTMPILADYWRWWLYLDFCWWHSSSTADDDLLMFPMMCWWFYSAAPINDRKSLMCWSDCLSTSPASCWCTSLLPIVDSFNYYSWTCHSLPTMDYDYPALSTADVGVFYVSSPEGPLR